MSFQVLEGLGGAVRGLVSHIRLDGGNIELYVLVDGPIDQRISPDRARGFTTFVLPDMEVSTGYLDPATFPALPRARAHVIGLRLRQFTDQLLAKYFVWPHVPD